MKNKKIIIVGLLGVLSLIGFVFYSKYVKVKKNELKPENNVEPTASETKKNVDKKDMIKDAMKKVRQQKLSKINLAQQEKDFLNKKIAV
jgi:isochorismate synthase EntC